MTLHSVDMTLFMNTTIVDIKTFFNRTMKPINTLKAYEIKQ